MASLKEALHAEGLTGYESDTEFNEAYGDDGFEKVRLSAIVGGAWLLFSIGEHRRSAPAEPSALLALNMLYCQMTCAGTG